MEDLSKQQIILLTLFVSFVTSIATGIFTVALMQQAPQGVTQTINRVVERTVERVVPTDASTAAVVKAVPTYEDVTAVATQKALKSIVKVVRALDGGGEIVEGYGVVLNKKGEIATDKIVTAVPGAYSVVLSDGTRFGADVVAALQGNDVSFLSPIINDQNRKSANFIPVAFPTNIQLSLGTTLLLIGGTKEASVYQGIVQNVEKGGVATAIGQLPISIAFSSGHGAMLGSALFNLTGELIGIKTQSVNSESSNNFLPAYMIAAATGLGLPPATSTSTVTTP